MSKKTQFESWLRRTQGVAVNRFGFEPEQADKFDLIDFGQMWEADLTPYQALEEYVGAQTRQPDMFENYLEDVK